LCVPGVSVEIEILAMPVVPTVPLFNTVAPSVNCTDPAGTVPMLLVTVLVKVIVVPTGAVGALLLIVVEVVACWITSLKIFDVAEASGLGGVPTY